MNRTYGFGRNTPVRPANKDELDAAPATTGGYGTKTDLDKRPAPRPNGSGGRTTGES